MIIGVCGVDGSGKSTIVKGLNKRLHLPIVKMSVNKKMFNSNIEEASKIFNDTVVQFKDIDFILDRFFIDSLVYKKVYKRNFDSSYLENIMKELEGRMVIVYVHANIDDIMKRREDDKFIDSSKYKDIISNYEEVLKDTFANRFDIIDIDSSKFDEDEAIYQTIKSLHKVFINYRGRYVYAR